MAISDANFSSSELGEFAELYEFYDGEYYSRYTTFQSNIRFMGFDYKPAHIKRGSIVRNATFEPVTVQITAPLDDKLTKYLSNYPVMPTTVKIFRVFVADPNNQYLEMFTGNITSVQVEDIYAVAQCTSLGSIIEAIWPPDVHSAFCQNTLYDENCKLSSSDYAINFTVQSFTGKGGLVSTEIGNGSPFTGGYVVFLKDFRWITLGEMNTFHLHVPFDSSVGVGTVLRAYWGCSKSAEDCKNKFNNMSNFFGCPYIPSDNPVLWGF